MDACVPPAFIVRPLDASTWPAFARLVEANGGIWGGCWCISFHLDPAGAKGQCKPYQETKHKLVCEGRARAALVFLGEEAVGWCQYGTPEELPNIKSRKVYESGHDVDADWRITCFYVGKGHRKKGVAKAALKGALAAIATLGGGVVEAFPEDVEGKNYSSSFLHGGTVAMFTAEGFEPARQIGKNRWVMRKRIPTLATL